MTEDTLQPFIEWIQTYPTWTGIIVCVISFSESLVGVGFFVPGVLLMTGIGALVGSGTLPLMSTLLWAILGAIIGDGVSFWFGYHYKEHLKDWWPFSRYPQWLHRGKIFFQHHGGTSIILGRFIGPIRPIIPVIAGIMNVRPITFYFFNVVSALVWAPLYSLPGYLFGLSVGVLDAKVGRRLVLLITLWALLMWGVYFVAKYLLRKSVFYIEKGLDRAWLASARFSLLHRLKDRRYVEFRPQLGTLLFSFGLGFALVYGYLCGWGLGLSGQGIDGVFWQISESFHSSEVILWSQVMAKWGDPRILAGFLGSLFVVAMLCRQRLLAVFFGLLIGFGLLAQAFWSWHFDTVFWMVSPLWTLLVFGGIALRLGRDLPLQYRSIPYFVATVLVVTASFAQLYLGAVFWSELWYTLLSGAMILSVVELHYRASNALSWYRNALKPLLSGFSVCTLLLVLCCVYKPFEQDRHRMLGGAPTVLQREDWRLFAVSPDGVLRRNFWGKPLLDLNVHVAMPLTEITQHLVKAGWQTLPPIGLLELLNWLSNEEKPSQHPDIPHFHQNKADVMVFVKPHATGRYALRLWRTRKKVGEIPLLVGTVLSQEWRQPIPLIHVYAANADYQEAFSVLQSDLQSEAVAFEVLPIFLEEAEKLPAAKGWSFETLLISGRH